MPEPRFNIRVYAIIIQQNQLLLSDEFVMGTLMTKLPGGGLEYGEGTLDCLHREMKEETGLDIRITGHFYTTDFFQKALFYDHTQLLSIYYKAQLIHPERLITSSRKHDFEHREGAQSFRWAHIQNMPAAELSFPIDRHVLHLLKSEIG
ncbi:NUDIX domain-containing protein [Breznakibacter xylanolyticus]|uniref:NUDIX domain-containing protein n=1 Tax=Breznakibacter xylanolyticus TaxID=990 RepID=A0A2W7MYT0_9BACT|nr:NUDIX domain-containing protein [Breznakibacter xylanolyticus]PZX12743.1 NUDIX domain-containing protein [Breznakibacter xylanolyticus]